jgi:hypothetical protein
MVNGKERTQQNIVQVQNTKGTKKVEILQNGKVLSSNEKPLTPKEIKNIQTRKFMPGLFSDCSPKTTCRPSRKNRKTRKNSHQ